MTATIRKSRKTRVLALILSIAMCLGIAPMEGFATETSTYTYNFERLQWGQWSSEGYTPSVGATTWGWETTAPNYYNRTTTPYIYETESPAGSLTWTSSSANRGPIFAATAVGNYYAYRVRLGQNGVYAPSVIYATGPSWGIVTYYLAPVGAADPRAAQYALGTVDGYTSDYRYNETLTFASQALAAGDYILSVKMTGKNNAATAMIHTLRSFTLGPPADPYIYTYNLERLQWGQWSNQGYAPSSAATTWGWENTAPNFFNRSTDPYIYESESPAGSLTWTSSSANRGPIFAASAIGDFYAYRIRVGQSGTYAPAVTYATGPSWGIVTYYLAPVNAPDPLAAQYALGTVDGYTSDYRLNETKVLINQSLTAGDYILSVKATGKNDSSTGLTHTMRAFHLGEAEVQPSYIYNLERLQWGQWSNEGYTPSVGATAWGWENTAPNYYNRTTDPYIYETESPAGSLTWTSSSANRGPIFAATAIGDFYAYRIRVAQGSTYAPSVIYATGPSWGIATYYLAPVGATDPRDAQYLLGTVDGYTTDYRYSETKTFSNQTLAAGDYILSVKMTGQNEAATGLAHTMRSFTLGVPECLYTLSAPDITVTAGESVQQEVDLYIDEVEVDFSQVSNLTVATEDPSVATAGLIRSTDNRHLYLLADGIYGGTTSAFVSGSYNGTPVSGLINITVQFSEANPIFAVTAASVDPILPGDTASSLLSGSINGVTESLDGATITVTSRNGSVATGTVSGSSVVVTGIGAGSTSLDVMVSKSNMQASCVIPVTVLTPVEMSSYKYNFERLQWGQWSNQGYTPSVGATEWGWESYSPNYFNRFTDPYIYDSESPAGSLTWSSSAVSRGPIFAPTTAGDYYAYRIRVDANGVYLPVVEYATGPSWGKASYYLAPATAADPRNEQYLLGGTDGYATTYAYDIEATLRTLQMTAGDYILSVKHNGKNEASTGKIHSMRAFRLDAPTSGNVVLHAEQGRTVPQGGTRTYEVFAYKNGAALSFLGASALSVDATGEATVSFSKSGDGTRAFLTVTGVAVETVDVTIGATFSGTPVTAVLPVIILPATRLDCAQCSVVDNSINAEETTTANIEAVALDDTAVTGFTVVYRSSNPAVATVSEAGLVTGISEGTAQISATVSKDGVSVGAQPATITVAGYPELQSAEIIGVDGVKLGGTTQLGVKGTLALGVTMPSTGATVQYQLVSASPAGAATVSAAGLVTGVAVGTFTVRATVTFDGVARTTPDKTMKVRSGKASATYYTPEKVAAARKNIATYAWASTAANNTIAAADQTVNRVNDLWNMVTTQQLPRNSRVGYRYDPEFDICRYCGVNIVNSTGNYYPWLYSVNSDPWKVQCPSCRRKFPSNDFGQFYQTGIDTNGNWNYNLAKANGSQYLTNDLYPEKGTGWGVDDGYGYRTGTYFTESGYTWEKTHTYIAYYNHWALWYNGYIPSAIGYNSLAYLFTGDAKYGRFAAIMIDRIADIYPAMSTGAYDPKYWNNGWYGGKILGGIWETGLASEFCKQYDSAFDRYDDPEVISFLSAKASQYNMSNTKTTGELIRQNVETNLLREMIAALKDKRIYGNFGFHQSTAAYVGAVLDTEPYTSDILDWDMNGEGAVNSTVIQTVGRDGAGNESSPGYNSGWAASMANIVDALDGYTGYTGADLYQNPKIIKMLKMNLPLILLRKTVPQIGDTLAMDYYGLSFNKDLVAPGFMSTNDTELGQLLYFLNGSTTSGLTAGMFMDAAELQERVQSVIDTHGPYDFDKSRQATDYGFSVIRSGTRNRITDTQRDFWLTYGSTQGHGHAQKLNLGIDAFGLNLAPDLGYPSTTLGTNDITYWERSTIIHNTVQVNNTMQTRSYNNEKPLHFGDDGRVKVMDINAPGAYSDASIYRRTVVMVDVGDDVSYGVDFFRIKGGNDHVYSFHALSNQISATTGLNLVAQSGGTYAGTSVPYGPGDVASGYDGFINVSRAANPSGKFAVDFAINDFRNHATTSGNLHLRMTMLNNFTANEVALADGAPPNIESNLSWIKFALVRRTGTNLDSLFTTVFEPYCNNRYIANEEAVSVTRVGGAEPGATDVARAIKVTLANGRIDYVVMATNKNVKYRIDNTFNFMGSIGVYTLENGVNTYSYLNDGTLIGTHTTGAAYTGSVVSFTQTLAFENFIVANLGQGVQVSKLPGKYINVANSGIYNAVYEIKGAELLPSGYVNLALGNCTLIRSTGYTYDIAVGQSVSIPLEESFCTVPTDPTPVFMSLGTQNGSVGNELRFTIRATSPLGNALIYTATSLPTGATFNTVTREFCWTPTQAGDYTATFRVTDGTNAATQSVAIHIT